MAVNRTEFFAVFMLLGPPPHPHDSHGKRFCHTYPHNRTGCCDADTLLQLDLVAEEVALVMVVLLSLQANNCWVLLVIMTTRLQQWQQLQRRRPEVNNSCWLEHCCCCYWQRRWPKTTIACDDGDNAFAVVEEADDVGVNVGPGSDVV